MYLSTENLLYHIILAIPCFFFILWLTGKFIKSKQYKYITAGILTILVTPILYIGVIAIFFSILFHEPTKKFNKSIWLSDPASRYQMSDNIIDSKLLIEKDTNQIKQMLGNPTTRSVSSNSWTYDMGMGGGGLGFLFHSLNITLVNGKATKVEHSEIKD